MGTDIQIFGEIRTENGWNLIGKMQKNSAFHPDDPNDDAPQFKPTELYDGRDYNLFDILGGLGRSRLRTLNGEKYETIQLRRGLPADLCPQIRFWREYWGDDAFGDNWLLLSEILDFDWHGKKMRFEADVDARVAYLFREDQAFPRAQWPSDIEISYSAYWRDGVKVRWLGSYADSVDPSFFATLDQLSLLGKPEDIRLIFWFDS